MDSLPGQSYYANAERKKVIQPSLTDGFFVPLLKGYAPICLKKRWLTPIFAAMEQQQTVRVRFAPSPTGGLHLGGVRTVLFNYLFAKQHGGKFILRIEDTDQTRYVAGAEQYIYNCLSWCGVEPDESPLVAGPFGPYRQSERKAMYQTYAHQLIQSGKAYYAFDTPEELEQMREDLKSKGSSSLQYDHRVRMQMKNSLTLSADETQTLIQNGTPYVIRLCVEPGVILELNDMVRGPVEMDTTFTDDKVLMKADGMPTYRLAVVVDDYLMKITHAFRGEEWLPSAPVHLLLWQHLFGLDAMPQWAHLPLILKPDGHGKLSKRDGDRLGFPVYAMNWKDPQTGEITRGFRETGFLPEAFINMLALLGWNDGSGQEVFSLEEMTRLFSMERVHKAGAKFDYEKAKWFNHQWIQKTNVEEYSKIVAGYFKEAGITIKDQEAFNDTLNLVKERCHLLTDFLEHAGYFYQDPVSPDVEAIRQKWGADKVHYFNTLNTHLNQVAEWKAEQLEQDAKQLAAEQSVKFAEIQLMLRIMLVGKKAGIGVFQIAEKIGREATCRRVHQTMNQL
ncbi:MAG TPA: glutamate--tRNA ligase [Ferruginibacter sp.]|nr:glutamate--tRNA ligase [Ferruginibacter sp.]